MLNFKNPPNGTISLQLVLPSPGNPITAFDLPSSHDIITIVHSNSNNSLDDYSSLQSSTFISNNENSAAARTGGGGGGGNLNGGGGCLVFYHLSNLVSPRHILHFEHSNSYEEITCLKYHPKDSSLLGLLKDGIITIYRPQHLLKPFNGFVQSSGKLLDMDWSPVHHHMLAAGCDTGAVKIYDMRSSLSTSILNLNSSSCNSMISWCPSEPHKIASANHDKVMIWDTRGGKGAIVDSLVCSFEPPYGVRQFVWCASDDKSISSIAISNVQSDVEWWNTQDGTLDKVVSEVVDEYSHILSSPVGQSVVTCKLETTDREQLTELRAETRKKNQSSDSLKDSDSENKLFESISKNIRVLLSRRDQTKMSLNMALNIIGYPRPVKSLNSLYDPTQSTECENRKSQLAVSPDPIIGMKWGTPGRLLPMHGGLELLALTSSATLHAISILPPIVDKYMRDEASKRTGSHGLSIESRNIIPMDLPKYSVDGLKRSFVTPTSIRNANVSKVDFNLTIGTMNDMSNEKDTFWKQLENEMLVLQEALEKGYLQGMTLGRIEQYARQITLEMMQSPVVHGSSSHGMTKKRGGSFYAIGEDIEVGSIPENSTHSFLSISEMSPKDVLDGFRMEEKGFSPTREGNFVSKLIISFPHKFPEKGYPSFVVKASPKLNVDAEAFEKEIAEIAKQAIIQDRETKINTHIPGGTVARASTGFLLEVARFFRNRILQLGGTLNETSNPNALKDVKLNEICAKATEELAKEETALKEKDGVKEDNNEGIKRAETLEVEKPIIIEQRAHRIPIPRTSAGIFSTLGVLSCFGGCKLKLTPVKVNDGEITRQRSVSDNESLDKDLNKGDATDFDEVDELDVTLHRDIAGHAANKKTPSNEPAAARTYADLLLHLREQKTKELHAMAMKRRKALSKAMSDEIDETLLIPSNSEHSSSFNQILLAKDTLQRDSSTSSQEQSDTDPSSDDDRFDDADISPFQNMYGKNEYSLDFSQAYSPPPGKSKSKFASTFSSDESEEYSTTKHLLHLTSARSTHVGLLGETLDKKSQILANNSMFQRHPVSYGSNNKFPLDITNTHISNHPKKVMIFHIYGDRLRKLAQAYSFSYLPLAGKSFSIIDKSKSHTQKSSKLNISAASLELNKPSTPRKSQQHQFASLNDLVVFGSSNNRGKAQQNLSETSSELGTPPKIKSALHSATKSHEAIAAADQSTNDLMLLRETNGKAIAEACRKNAGLAFSIKDESVGHIWNLLATCFELKVLTKFAENYDKIDSVRLSVRCGLSKSWVDHPLGRPLLRRIFTHLGIVGDLQTLATIICTLGGAATVAFLLDDSTLHTAQTLDRILMRYCDILHRWQCHLQATEVSKYVSQRDEKYTTDFTSNAQVGLAIRCHCGFDSNNIWCKACKSHAIHCSLCNNAIKTTAFFCPECGHGGHMNHMKEWFEQNPECATGCGCRCAELEFYSDLDAQNEADARKHNHSNELAVSIVDGGVAAINHDLQSSESDDEEETSEDDHYEDSDDSVYDFDD